MQIGIEIDLDDTVADGVAVFFLGGPGTTVENEEDRLLFGALLFLDVLLMLVKQLWVKADVARLVNAVDVAEASGDGEIRRNLLQRGIDLVDVLGLSVERVVVDVFIVNTILLTASDTNFLLVCKWSFSFSGPSSLPSPTTAS